MRARGRRVCNSLALFSLAAAMFAVAPLGFAQQSSNSTDARIARAVEGSSSSVVRHLQTLALSFERNSASSQVKFLAHGSRSTLLLTTDEAVLTPSKKPSVGSRQLSGHAKQTAEQSSLRMKFAAA